jgi:hypothetical protein
MVVSPGSFTGWATYSIDYFTVRCVWSDGRKDRHCRRAGKPKWLTDYGWFERIPHGLAKTRMKVAPLRRRMRTTRAQTVLWSTDFNTSSDARGHVTVTYGGASAGADGLDDEILGVTAPIDEMIVRRVRAGGLGDIGELCRKAEF